MREALLRLRKAMVAVAAADTAYESYNPARSPLHAHCGAVAHVVQKRYGGTLVGATIEGQRHIWNRLEDGTEVDLTSDQFGGDGYLPVGKGRALRERATTNERFALFEQRLASTCP